MAYKNIRSSFQGRQEYREPARALLEDTSDTGFKPAESIRAWCTPPPPFSSFPTWCSNEFGWRVWDDCSQSQLNNEGVFAFEAAETTWPLRSQVDRARALATHADHKKWTSTPMVSATMKSVDAVYRAARQARNNRGQVRVSLIDLRWRWETGLPMIHAEAELKAYGVPDPYGRDYQYYRDEVLCLWGITQDEVVHTWLWEEIAGLTAEELQRASQEKYHGRDASMGTRSGPTGLMDDLPDLEDKMSRLMSTSPANQTSTSSITPEPLSKPSSQASPTDPTGSWLLLNLQGELLLVQHLACDKNSRMISTLPLFRLTASCLPEDTHTGFDTAYLGVKRGTMFVVATCQSFLLRWNIETLLEGEIYPSTIKKYKSKLAAQVTSVKKSKKCAFFKKALGLEKLVNVAAIV